MPATFIGKRVLFATSHTQPQWRVALCLTSGESPTGIDLVFAQPLSNGQCAWRFRDACRHIDDPASKDPNYLANIEHDNEGGLWKEDADSLAIARLQADVAQLKALLADKSQPVDEKVPNWKKAQLAKTAKKKSAAEESVPVPAAALVMSEPELDLVGGF